MTEPTRTDPSHEKLLRLVADGVSVRGAAKAAGIPQSTAVRIVAASGVPFSGGPQPVGQLPAPNWDSDQPRPAPVTVPYTPGYSDRTFQSFSAPIGFDGFTLPRVRGAISQHRQGLFLESSTLAITVLTFAPILAALAQRMAPALALPRMVKGGTGGLTGYLSADVEAQLAPRAGLSPSPYFPPTLWGAMGFDLTFMRFSVLQHVVGTADPTTGVMPVYTRQWPTWAVQYYRYRKTFVAITDAGPIDICNDGHFTLVADATEPHYEGAIVALGEEAYDGLATKRARASWIDKYGNPKLVGTMPANVAVNSPEGRDFFAALATLRGPDGFGALPFNAKLEWQSLVSGQSTALADALGSNLILTAMAILGTDGTVAKGATGVYASPMFEGIARTLVDRDIKAMVRGVNLGHVKTWLDLNYGQTIAAERVMGRWISPVLDIPLPDPDADARIKSLAERNKAVVDQVVAERDSGMVVDQDRVDQLCKAYDVAPMRLADVQPAIRLDIAPTDVAKVVTADQILASQGLPPDPDPVRGAMTIPQRDALDAAAANAPPAAVDPATGLSVDPAAEDDALPPDDSAKNLAADMTAHSVTACEHGKKNRCRLCGVERERELVPGENGADHTWKVKWRAIPKPGDATPGEEAIDAPSTDPTAPVAAPEDDGAGAVPATTPQEGATP